MPWVLIITFNAATPPPKAVYRDTSRPRVGGLLGLADWATRLGRLPRLSCKRETEKIGLYMDRRVTPLQLILFTFSAKKTKYSLSDRKECYFTWFLLKLQPAKFQSVILWLD